MAERKMDLWDASIFCHGKMYNIVILLLVSCIDCLFVCLVCLIRGYLYDTYIFLNPNPKVFFLAAHHSDSHAWFVNMYLYLLVNLIRICIPNSWNQYTWTSIQTFSFLQHIHPVSYACYLSASHHVMQTRPCCGLFIF